MMDGSLMADGKTPATFDYNVEVTRKVVELAHAKGVTVEGELGCSAASKTATARALRRLCRTLTDPEQAERVRRSRPAWTRWPSPSAPATAPTSSPRKPTGEVLAMDR